MASIIVPAHNEAGVIADTLRALLGQLAEQDEVIVVVNGCTDATESIARGFEPRIRVIHSPIPSKVAALNLGDQHATRFPRVYLDADVVLKDGALARIKSALNGGAWLAASPEPEMDLSASSWAVRAYYDIWLSLPYCRSGMIGAGAYALSEQGRQRFAAFPDVIADDGYVRALFKEHERGKVTGAVAVVRAPASLRWLLKIKTRSRLGYRQLAMAFPGLLGNEEKAYGSGIRAVLRNPLKWPGAAVYLYVNLVSRFLAARRLRNLAQYRWEKDVSSRQQRAAG